MQRKVPIRMCTGCREKKPKKQLVRVVKSPDGLISIDLTGKKSGRGAYICRDITCLKKAEKTKALQRALECEINPEVFDSLTQELLMEDDDDE